MTILTIPNKSLIRYLPSGQRAEPVTLCHDPSLARVDSSRILMTYLARTAGSASRICACYLDEECVADASSNAILSVGFGLGEPFSLYQNGPEILGICNQSCELARFRFDHSPETEIVLLNNKPRGRLLLFKLNGSLMGMSELDIHLLHNEQHGYVCHTIQKGDVSMSVFPGKVSGLARSGDGWVLFYLTGLITDGFFMARMEFDGSFSLEFPERPVVSIPNISELGTPMRHADGWALPFDDGSGVCKIALIADSEIEPTLPNAPEPS